MRDQRGLTLIEVLVAFVILFVVTLAVLSMFSLAAAVNSGAFARTDMMYAAEKVVEVIRTQQALSKLVPPVNDATCCPLDAGTSYSIPSTGCENFWGAGGGTPSFGAGVYSANARYTLSYSIVLNATTSVAWREITVTAQPKAGGYSGVTLNPAGKAVRYVAQIPGQ